MFSLTGHPNLNLRKDNRVKNYVQFFPHAHTFEKQTKTKTKRKTELWTA